MAAKTPESTGLTVVPLLLLPFLSSAVVPAAKMGQGVWQFARVPVVTCHVQQASVAPAPLVPNR